MIKNNLKTIPIAAFCAVLGAGVVALATQTNYLGTVFIADTTTPANQLKVNSDGSINANVSGGGGSGTVTSVATGNGLSGGPITTTGTISCNQATSAAFGCVEVDGTTITAAAGVISAAAGAGPFLPLAGGTLTGPVSTNSQITSTLATGTAPLVVASTTNVANLNASSLSGATFAAPGAIGGTTASTGKFTTATIGAGSAITSSGPGGALGSNAFNSTAFISGLTVGTTTITSGSSTNIEYNNGGVLGEYTISGTGTAVAMTASPTFTGTVGAAAITATGILRTSSAGSAAAPSLVVGNSTTGCYSVSTTGFGCSVNGGAKFDYGITTAGTLTALGQIVATTNVGSSSNTGLFFIRNGTAVLSAPAAATWQLGNVDAASPVAQTLEVQNVAAGNANTAGVAWTLQGSLSNGSGAGGNIVLATTQSTAASGTQNTALAGITILGGTQLVEINQISSDAGLTDTTVCQDTTLHGLHAGTGTAGICLGNVSSLRFKHDWQPLVDGLSVMNALDPATYRYNDGIADGGTQLRVGFSAERYAEVLPQFTRYDSEGKPNGLDMLAAFPYAVSAIQQLDARVRKLERRVH
jgi:hypothetical protein